MYGEALALFGILFWILLGVLTILIFISDEQDTGGFGVACLVIFVLLCVLFGDVPERAKAHPWWAVAAPFCWVAIGLATCIPRWILTLRRLRREYDEQLEQFLNSHQASTLTAALYEAWRNEIPHKWRSRYGLDFDIEQGKVISPPFRHNRGRLVFWATCWPWVLVWSLVHDLVTEAIERFGKLFQYLSERAFRGL